MLNDSSGLPLKEALVQIYRPHGLWVTSTHTDTVGEYQANLDSGKYLVRFDKDGFIPEWFDNAFNVESAFLIDLHQDSTIIANASLQPVRPPAYGTIEGVVVDDSTGLPVKEAFATFFRPQGLWVQRVHTDTTGAYHAEVPVGRYIFRFEKFGYVPEWFDNVHEVRDAFVVDVHADTTITANAGLQPIHRPEPVTVSGLVTDSASGQPIPNAFVAFLRPFSDMRDLERERELLGGSDDHPFFLPGFGRLAGVVWSGFTNDTGLYEAPLLRGVRYIAFSFKLGSKPEFYKDQPTPFHANILTFQGDSSGINFDLVHAPIATNSFAGRVADTAGTGVPSYVMLIRVTPLGWFPVRFELTDSAGGYMFQFVVDGRFIVRAIPLVGYAPAWYKAGACGVRNWHNAEIVEVSSNVAGIDLCVRQLDESGFGHIDGQITAGGNRQIFSAGGGEANAVYAVSTTTGEVVGYDITEGDGSYSLDNLPAGSYSIVADKEGFTPSNSPTITVDESNGFASSGNNVGVTVDSPLGVGEDEKGIPQTFALGQNYPNPFNPTTEFHFDVAQRAHVTISIFNVLGQKVATIADQQMDPGSYVARWSGNTAHGVAAGSGVYFYRMDADNFHDLKKMILMK